MLGTTHRQRQITETTVGGRLAESGGGPFTSWWAQRVSAPHQWTPQRGARAAPLGSRRSTAGAARMPPPAARGGCWRRSSCPPHLHPCCWCRVTFSGGVIAPTARPRWPPRPPPTATWQGIATAVTPLAIRGNCGRPLSEKKTHKRGAYSTHGRNLIFLGGASSRPAGGPVILQWLSLLDLRASGWRGGVCGEPRHHEERHRPNIWSASRPPRSLCPPPSRRGGRPPLPRVHAP